MKRKFACAKIKMLKKTSTTLKLMTTVGPHLLTENSFNNNNSTQMKIVLKFHGKESHLFNNKKS